MSNEEKWLQDITLSKSLKVKVERKIRRKSKRPSPRTEWPTRKMESVQSVTNNCTNSQVYFYSTVSDAHERLLHGEVGLAMAKVR